MSDNIFFWNLQHTSGYQSQFLNKNSFIVETIEHCVRELNTTIVILIEVTDDGFIKQIAQRLRFHLTIYGQKPVLHYAILTRMQNRVENVSPYYQSFKAVQRDIVSVYIGPKKPRIQVTHIKSDQGVTGTKALQDIVITLTQMSASLSHRFPMEGVITIADWNLEMGIALGIIRKIGGPHTIHGPQIPTRVPSFSPTKVLTVINSKTLDYALFSGALLFKKPGIQVEVPNFTRTRTFLNLLAAYKQRLDVLHRGAKSELQNIIATPPTRSTARSQQAWQSSQAAATKKLQEIETSLKGFAEISHAMGRRQRLSPKELWLLLQAITQKGLGPDHFPIVILGAI